MMSKNRIVLLLVLIVLLGVVGYRAWDKEIEPQRGTTTKETYQSEAHGFEFQYDEGLNLAEGLGAIVLVSKVSSYGLERVEGEFRINFLSQKNEYECVGITREYAATSSVQTINGREFTMFPESTGKTYLIFENGKCYAVSIFVSAYDAEGNQIPPERVVDNPVVKEYADTFDQILQTLTFTN